MNLIPHISKRTNGYYQRSVYPPQGEISAVTCIPMEKKDFATVIAASFWGSNVVGIYSVDKPNGPHLICASPELPALPRSLLFYSFGTEIKTEGYAPHLLVGLADGTAASFKYKNRSLQEKKLFSLGELPVFMSACKVENKHTVFACGSRASILFWDRETLQHSAVNLKVRIFRAISYRYGSDEFQDVAAASWLNTTRFPSCLVLATPSGLLIGTIKVIDKMHIRSVRECTFLRSVPGLKFYADLHRPRIATPYLISSIAEHVRRYIGPHSTCQDRSGGVIVQHIQGAGQCRPRRQVHLVAFTYCF